MITPALVLRLGVSQLVCWGISYYLIGVLAEPMAMDLGWSRTVAHAGFSVALVVMGLSSPRVGMLTERHGGRPVMVVGSCLTAAGCAMLASSHGAIGYFASWVVLGLAMRMTLYDAAFAALVRLGGPSARRPISQVTLLGGLASTVFWPLGHALATRWGWRAAVLVYAALALLTLPLHLAIPRGTHERSARPSSAAVAPLATTRAERRLAASLYVIIATGTAILNTAMSSHMIGILVGLGLTAAVAVWISTLRGVGQSLARLAEVLFGGGMSPLGLAILATALLPASFVAGLFSGSSTVAAMAFAVLFGAGNGLVTVVRGTMPLVLFDTRSYGSFVGVLLVPSFLVAALGPLAYAFVSERAGDAAALHASIVIGLLVCAAAVGTRLWFGRAARSRPSVEPS